MFCTQCGLEFNEEDRFCSRCGLRTPAGRQAAMSKRLLLDKREKKIGGVCAGFARYAELDVTLVRVLWLIIAISTGIGFLAYLAAWIVIPSDHGLNAASLGAPSPQMG
jgi:phage shock protein C